MTDIHLKESLNHTTHSKESRTKMASRFVANPEQLPALLKIAFTDEKPLSSKACWILDMVARDNLELLLPHLDYFCQNLGNVKLDSSIRPLAKICEMLVLSSLRSTDPGIFKEISDGNLEAIATVCFDWLITEQKVAPQAYSMTSLYYLGHRFPWIHEELRQVLEKNYAQGSAAYKARARQVLQKLNR